MNKQPTETAYKGYSIKLNPFRSIYYITKGGFHIGTAPTIEEAKKLIDELV